MKAARESKRVSIGLTHFHTMPHLTHWRYRSGKHYPFPKQALVFTCLQDKPFENNVGKGEIACNDQFLLFPQCFLAVSRHFCYSYQIWNCHLQILSVWKSLKFVIWERVKRKGETACNKQFLLFLQCFLSYMYMALIFHIKCILKCHLQFVPICPSLKFCRLVKC